MGTRRYRKIIGKCEVQIAKKNGKITFKCRNLKRLPHAQEIIDSLDTKIIYK